MRIQPNGCATLHFDKSALQNLDGHDHAEDEAVVRDERRPEREGFHLDEGGARGGIGLQEGKPHHAALEHEHLAYRGRRVSATTYEGS